MQIPSARTQRRLPPRRRRNDRRASAYAASTSSGSNDTVATRRPSASTSLTLSISNSAGPPSRALLVRCAALQREPVAARREELARRSDRAPKHDSQVREGSVALHLRTQQRSPVVDHVPRCEVCDERIPIVAFPARSCSATIRHAALANRGGDGSVTSASKRASASAWRSVSNISLRVTTPSAPKTQRLMNCRSKAPPLARSVPGVGPLHEECVGLQNEDVVDDPHEVVGHLGQLAETSNDHFGPAPGSESEGPVVDEIDIRCECRRVAIAVERPKHRRDRARAVAAARARAGPSGRRSA